MPQALNQAGSGLHRLTLFWRTSRWEAAKTVGLNPTQCEILSLVAARPERLADLAFALGISQASLSDSVAALERKRMLVRRPDPEDGRARQIVATEAGRALVARLPEVPEALQRAIAGLSPADTAGLLRALTLIIRSLQEARAIPVQRMCLTCCHFRPHVHDDPARPHHCAFVDAAFGDAALRLDCADHETATEEEVARALSAVG